MASPGGALAACAPPSPPFDSRAALGEAVAALYTSPDPRARAAADAWLQQFLRSDHAWPLSLRMLRDGEDLTSIEALFCARALHVLLRKSVVKAERTQRSHAVLDADDWTGAREALLRLHVGARRRDRAERRVGGGRRRALRPPPRERSRRAPSADAAASRAVLTQVALALAALACKMDAWDPASIVPDVLRYFSSSSSGGDGGGRAPSSGAACFLHVLAALPEECASKDLSVHPARREAVRARAQGRRRDLGVPGDGCDLARRVRRLRAGARVSRLRRVVRVRARLRRGGGAERDARVRTRGVTSRRFCSRRHARGVADRLLDAAQAAVASALVEATHRPSRRDALAAALAAIREAIRESPGPWVGFEYAGARPDEHSDEHSRLHRLTQILASVAVRASEPAPVARVQAEAVKDPLAVGPAAAGDRAYVPYKQFAEMRKEAKRSGRGKSRAADANDADGVLDPLEGADGDALAFCLDALAEAMATGAASPRQRSRRGPPSPARWNRAGFSPTRRGRRVTPHSTPRSRRSSRRCARARRGSRRARAGARVDGSRPRASPRRTTRGAGRDRGRGDRRRPVRASGGRRRLRRGAFDEENRRGEDGETLSEGRDVARCVGADAFVACVVDRFRDRVEALYATAEERAVAACEGWLFSLFAVARLTSDSRRTFSESVEATVAGVTAARRSRRTSGARPAAPGIVAWTVAGFCHKAPPTCGEAWRRWGRRRNHRPF